MNKDKKLVLRLTQAELDKLKAFADYKEVTMSHILREYIRRLPKPQPPLTSDNLSDRER